MRRIGVINNMKVILPCEMDAPVTVYEIENGEMTRLKERQTVKTLISIQQETFDTSYPPNEEYIWYSYKRLDELICGDIEAYLKSALECLSIHVTDNVYGWMDTFETDYRNGTLKKLADRVPRQAVARDVKSYVHTVWPDLDDIRNGYSDMKPVLSDPDKLWLLDQWADSEHDWSIFDTFISIFDLPISLDRAMMYARRFLLVDRYKMQIRSEDVLSFQQDRRHHIELILSHIDPSVKPSFIDECLIIAAKNRLILIVELLMDHGADIGYVNKRGYSVQRCEKKMVDLTMLSYLEYYRENGRKDPKVDTEALFTRDHGSWIEIYQPEILVEGVTDVKSILDAHTEEVEKKILSKYGKSTFPEEDTQSLELERFVNRYDWKDGPSIPHLIANHKNCTEELVEKMYATAERRLENTDENEEEMILLWKCFMSELGKLYDFLRKLERWDENG